MEIGDIVVLTQDHTFVFNHYKKGHKFRITGRKIFIDREIGKEVTAFDIQSLETMHTTETIFNSKHLVNLSDLREERLKELGI